MDNFNILSWNIDGLHERDLEHRYKEVASIIEAKRFSIVFLQEVIPKALDHFKKTLNNYTILAAQEKHDQAKSSKEVSLIKVLSNNYYVDPLKEIILRSNAHFSWILATSLPSYC